MVILGLTLNDVEPTVVMWDTNGKVPVPVRNARALDIFEGAANWVGWAQSHGLQRGVSFSGH